MVIHHNTETTLQNPSYLLSTDENNEKDFLLPFRIKKLLKLTCKDIKPGPHHLELTRYLIGTHDFLSEQLTSTMPARGRGRGRGGYRRNNYNYNNNYYGRGYGGYNNNWQPYQHPYQQPYQLPYQNPLQPSMHPYQGMPTTQHTQNTLQPANMMDPITHRSALDDLIDTHMKKIDEEKKETEKNAMLTQVQEVAKTTAMAVAQQLTTINAAYPLNPITATTTTTTPSPQQTITTQLDTNNTHTLLLNDNTNEQKQNELIERLESRLTKLEDDLHKTEHQKRKTMIENLELKMNLNKLKQDNDKLTRDHKKPRIVSVLSDDDDTDSSNTNKNNNNDTDTSEDNNDTVTLTEEGEIKGYEWYIEQLPEIKKKKDFKNNRKIIAQIGKSPQHFKLPMNHHDLLPPNKKTKVSRGRSIDLITAYCLETFTDANDLLERYGTQK